MDGFVIVIADNFNPGWIKHKLQYDSIPTQLHEV